ncbi:putative glycosyl hydrolase [Zancudomyces culisetae]|nr:putative glycosyl hydrolase [Zancudomyces culisetae]|eukprot:OMH81741.1 putative glycosyl hydrolase [Zancudomyces culisetae]
MLQTEALPGTLIKLDEYTLQTATEITDGQALATTTTTEPMTTTMVAGTATTAALKDAVPESFGTSKVQEGADDPANTTRVIESSPENSKIAIFEFTKGESKYIVDKFKKIANSRNEAQDLSDIQGLGISNRDFIDFKGRKVYIRGINVGGHCKLPYSPKEDKNEYENGVFVGDGGFGRASHELNGFYDHRSVSFIMHNEGLKCIIDPHQDMWSRYCGGSGAPGWTLEVAGLEMRNFKDTGAALVHCEARTEEESAPKMMWVTNATKLATSTMFTVFFGGKIFAPKAKIDGPNTVPPTFEGGELGGNVAYAPHWYDLYSLFNKKFEGKISYNVLELQNSINIIKHVYFGKKGAVSNYTKQLDLVRRRGLIHVGETPTIIGECGIPMDINGRAAYKTDDYKYQIIMMDSLMKAMENTCLGFTLWNYNPFNDNDFGDYWNGEDFSVASRSSIRHGEGLDKYDKNKVIGMRNRPKKMGRLNKNYQRDLITLNNGGRVLEAIIRPYITRMRQCIELNKTKFRYKKKRFTFRVTVSNRECRKLQMYNSNGMEHGMGFGFGNSDIANGNRNGVNGGSGDNNAGTALAKSGSWMYSLVPTRKSLKEGSVELGRSMFSGNLKYLNRIGRRGFNSVINIYTGGSGTGGGENERSNRYSDSITINSDGSSDRASSHNTETRTDYCRSLISNSSGDEVSTRDGGSQWRFRLPSLDFSLKTPERIREKVMRISGSSGSSGGSSDGGGDLEPNSTSQLILAKTENRRDLVDGKPRGTLEYQDGDAGNGGNQDNNSSGSDSDRDIPEDDEHGIVVGGESDDNYNEEQAGNVDDDRGEKKGGKMRYINTRITNKIIEKSSDGVKKLSMKSKSMYRPIELGRLYFSGTGGDNDKKKADTFDGALKDTRPNALGLTNDNKPPQLYSLPSPSMSSSTPALHNVRSADLNDSEKHNSDFPNEKARNNSGTRGKRSERKRGAAVENKIMGFVNEHIGSYSLAIYVPHYHYGNSPLQIVVRTKEGPKLNYSYCYVPQLQSLFLKFSPLATNVKSLINVTIKKKNKFSRNHKMFSTFDKQEFLKSESGNGGNGGNTGSSVSSTTINNSPTTPTTPINDIPNILPMDIGAGGNESTTKNDHTASTPPNNSSNGSFTGGKNNENEKQSPSGTTVLNKKLMMFQIGKSFYYHPDITNSNLAGNNSNNRMNTKDNGGVSTTSNEIVVRNEHTFKPSSQPGLNKPDTKNGNNADKSTQDTKNGEQNCTGEDQNVRNNNGNAQTEKKDDKAGGNEQNLDGCGLVSSFIF